MFSHKPGGTKDSVSISYHQNPRKTGWKKRLYQDEETKEIYTYYIYRQDQYIAKLDKKTGLMGPMLKLHFRYVDDIKIKGGKVYYIYRPFESYQNKFIYRENIYNLAKVSIN